MLQAISQNSRDCQGKLLKYLAESVWAGLYPENQPRTWTAEFGATIFLCMRQKWKYAEQWLDCLKQQNSSLNGLKIASSILIIQNNCHWEFWIWNQEASNCNTISWKGYQKSMFCKRQFLATLLSLLLHYHLLSGFLWYCLARCIRYSSRICKHLENHLCKNAIREASNENFPCCSLTSPKITRVFHASH